MGKHLLALPGYREAAEAIVAEGVVFDRRKLSNRVCADGYCAMVAVMLKMGTIADEIGDGLPGEREVVSRLLGRDYDYEDAECVALREEVSAITWRNDRGDLATVEEVRHWLLLETPDPGKAG